MKTFALSLAAALLAAISALSQQVNGTITGHVADCHDPHEPAGRKRAADYNRQCALCHTNPGRPPKPACLAQTPANCIDCHMPMISPQPPLRFTNHWIGVYRDGAKLKPLR